MRRIQCIVVVMAFAGVLTVVSGPAGADPGMACKGEYIVTASPGLGTKPADGGSLHTGGESGKLDCGTGGTGTIGIDGRFDKGSTCAGGSGWGVFSYTYGSKTVKDTLTFDFGRISHGVISGRYVGEHYSGTFTSTPVEGDCVTEPATKAVVKLDGTIN